MNKKNVIGSILILGILLVVAVVSLNSLKRNAIAENQSRSQKQTSSKQKQAAEKIEVFVFHATQRCISCITIGKYAKETVDEYFQPELRDGKIDFREINIDLPENKDLARKFQASGSSLFINAIIDGKDNITEDTTVWRLVSNEDQFKNYLKNKLNNLFGK